MSDPVPALSPPAPTTAKGAPEPTTAKGTPEPTTAKGTPAPKSLPSARGPGVVLTALALALLTGGMFWSVAQQQDLAARMAVQESDAVALREELRAVGRRVVALENRPAPLPAEARPIDLRPLEARLAALESRPAAAAATPDGAAADRLAGLEARLARAEQAAARAPALARLAAALEGGRPLGLLPAAPPALARYATIAPPTEAGLRLAFPEAARRARDASRPPAAAGMAERLWQRLSGLVTVREGDAVLLGSPAAAVLGQTAQRLAAGDLAGAVAALDALDAAAAGAMAGWREQATGLLAARAALAAMMAE
jgi:hypothetical protein